MNRDSRRVIRVNLEEPIKVTMGSIGSDIRYDLESRDISNSGFFLDFAKPGRFPFTPASIMEIWMDFAEEGRIFFNGKMARVVYPTESAAKVSGPGIAVRIVQIEAGEEKRLIDFIMKKNKEQGTTKTEDDTYYEPDEVAS